MKSSNELMVKTSLILKDDLVIHPNEGYDLGLMLHATPVKIFGNVTIDVFNQGEDNFIEGNILLENQCRPLTIEMPKSFWRKIGRPHKVKLFYENNRVLVANV